MARRPGGVQRLSPRGCIGAPDITVLSRQSLERHQALIYLAAILAGLAFGGMFPGFGALPDRLLWLLLGALLYVTFTQVPLGHLRDAFADLRFLVTAVIGNFLVLPAIAFGLLVFLPDDPAVRLGVLLVLLVPCTDWFITFTQLAGGDAKRAIAFTPLSLLLQIVLVPVYLWLFLGGGVTVSLARAELLWAFAGLILLPLFAALLTEKWMESSMGRVSIGERLAWLPVPLLAIVVFTIAASQVHVVLESGALFGRLLLVFVLFLGCAAVLARLLSALSGLPWDQGRVLAFSFGTRNSFVVLPLALALPASFEVAVVVIVFQSLVELFGMVVFLRWVPARLFPAAAGVRR